MCLQSVLIFKHGNAGVNCYWHVSTLISDDAVGALHHAGAISVINSTPDNLNDAEVEKYKSSLLKRFREFRYDTS